MNRHVRSRERPRATSKQKARRSLLLSASCTVYSGRRNPDELKTRRDRAPLRLHPNYFVLDGRLRRSVYTSDMRKPLPMSPSRTEGMLGLLSPSSWHLWRHRKDSQADRCFFSSPRVQPTVHLRDLPRIDLRSDSRRDRRNKTKALPWIVLRREPHARG